MAADVEVVAWDREAFVSSFRSFHRSFEQAMEAGVPIEQLVLILHQEGVELPPFILQMLGL